MSEVLFENVPTWVPILIMALPWINVIIDVIKTQKILNSFIINYEFITWSFKMSFLLILGRISPLPDDPWVLLLLLWGLFDMRVTFFSNVINRKVDNKTEDQP